MLNKHRQHSKELFHLFTSCHPNFCCGLLCKSVVHRQRFQRDFRPPPVNFNCGLFGAATATHRVIHS